MITFFLISFLAGTFESLLSLLPMPTALPAGIDSAISYFVPIWSQLNYILPMDTLFSLLSFVLVVESSILVFSLFNFAYNKLRGSG